MSSSDDSLVVAIQGKLDQIFAQPPCSHFTFTKITLTKAAYFSKIYCPTSGIARSV
jgi:hypothetical protein